MNFRRRNKCADAATALDDAFAFERGQGVACSHQADSMELGQVAFGAYRVAGTKMARVNALPDSQLDALVSGQSKANLTARHSVHLIRKMQNRREKALPGRIW